MSDVFRSHRPLKTAIRIYTAHTVLLGDFIGPKDLRSHLDQTHLEEVHSLPPGGSTLDGPQFRVEGMLWRKRMAMKNDDLAFPYVGPNWAGLRAPFENSQFEGPRQGLFCGPGPRPHQAATHHVKL